MKKLMIAAAIVCAAAFAQAAQCNWTVSSITSSPDATKAAGWAVYLMPAAKYTEFIALTGDKVAAYAEANKIVPGATKAGAHGAINVAETTGSYSKGQTESAFVVIFDNANAANAKNYAYTATKTSDPVGDSDANIALAYGTFSSAAVGGWHAAAIPEPTSGLLLLLGVAGLALKRRRA